MTRPPYLLLYDRDCGFCEWIVGVIQKWSRHPVHLIALQDVLADEVLASVASERRMVSWHVVTPEGAVHSGGDAVPVVLRLLPGRNVFPRVVGKLPRLVDAAYAMVARNRGRISRFMGRSWCAYELHSADQRPGFNRRLFFVLWGVGLLGSIAIVPYKMNLWPSEIVARYDLNFIVAADIFLNGILFAGLPTYFGLRTARSVGLGAPILERWLTGKQVRESFKRILAPSLIAGGLSALIIAPLHILIFAPRLPPSMLSVPDPTVWQASLASVYGAITEELVSRLGILSIAAWALSKRGVRRPYWAANAVAAFLFGLGHLPATASIAPLTAVVVTRGLMLNGVPGLVFGHLYWTRGLESAMLAHFMADVIIHVIPSVVATF